MIIGLCMVCLTVGIYARSLKGGYLWDDDLVVSENVLLRSAAGLRHIWASPDRSPQGYYWPVTYTSFWLEYRVWGVDPAGYRIVNLALHLVNAFLLWAVLRQYGMRWAWAAAFLFAVHPVQVESVAWIAERKNTLSLTFMLASILTFSRASGGGRAGSRAASLLLFTAAMLSKSGAVLLPAVLFLLSWWRGRRVRPMRLLPFVTLSVAIGGWQVWVYARQGALNGALSIVERLILAGKCFWFYLGKMVWPFDMSAVYPRWHVAAFGPVSLAWPFAGLIVTVALYASRRRIGRGPFTAWSCYAIGLLPMLHLVSQSGFTSITYVNDHAQYAASAAFCAALSHVGARLTATPLRFAGAADGALGSGAGRRDRVGPALVWGAFAALLLVWSFLSYRHAARFTRMETLFTHALQQAPDAWAAHVNLGVGLVGQGDAARARYHLREALRINPRCVEAMNALGVLLAREGRYNEAIARFKDALRYRPDSRDALRNLSLALKDSGRLGEARVCLRNAIRLNQDDPVSHFLLGTVLVPLGAFERAAACFEKAVALDPSYAAAYHNLAAVRQSMGDLPAAAAALERVLALQPGNEAAAARLAGILESLDR